MTSPVSHLNALLRFQGLDLDALRPVVNMLIALMGICATIWMIAVAALAFVIELNATAPMYVALGLSFLSLYGFRTQLSPHGSGTALCLLLFLLAILASFTLHTLGAGVVTTAVASSIALLVRGFRFALLGLLVTTLARILSHTLLAWDDTQADVHSAIMAMAASIMLPMGIYALIRLVINYQNTLTETSRRLARLGSDRTAMFELLAQDIAPPIAEIRTNINDKADDLTARRKLHVSASELMQVIDGLDAALSVRELPPLHYQGCDLPALLSEVQAQGSRLLKPRGISVHLQNIELPVHFYRVDIARLRAITVSAAQTMYLMDDSFKELTISAFGRRVSDSEHRIVLTLSVDHLKYSIEELERAMAGGHAPREADEFTVMSFFEDIGALAHDLSATLQLHRPSANSDGVSLTIVLMLEPGTLPQTGEHDHSVPMGFTVEGQRVLLIDDDAVQRRVVSQIIRDNFKADVITAASAGEAIKFLTKDNDFALVITDQYMPGMKGSDLIRYLHDMDINTPVIGMTAAAQRSELVNLYEAGAAAALVKPLTPDSLRTALAKIPVNHG